MIWKFGFITGDEKIHFYFWLGVCSSIAPMVKSPTALKSIGYLFFVKFAVEKFTDFSSPLAKFADWWKNKNRQFADVKNTDDAVEHKMVS